MIARHMILLGVLGVFAGGMGYVIGSGDIWQKAAICAVGVLGCGVGLYLDVRGK